MSWVGAKYKRVLKMPTKPWCGSPWLSGQVSHQKHPVALHLAWAAHMPEANASQGSMVPLLGAGELSQTYTQSLLPPHL